MLESMLIFFLTLEKLSGWGGEAMLSDQKHLEGCLSTKYKVLNTLELGVEDQFLFGVKNDFLET